LILSCSTITYGKLGGAGDFERLLASLKGVGYSDAGIEYPLLPESLKKNPEVGGAAAKRAGLTVSAVAIDTSPSMPHIVKSFGASVGWLCLFERDIEVAIEKTRGVAAACTRSGVDLSLHPHTRSNITTTEELDKIMKACSPYRTSVTVDTAHLTALDIDVPKFIGRYKGVLSLVHLKDLRVKLPQSQVDYSRDFVDLGDGVADLKGSIQALRDVGYTGAVMVEVDYPQEGTVDLSVKKNYRFLSSLMPPGA
jgi:sugar phosphate isomerase/epimerase